MQAAWGSGEDAWRLGEQSHGHLAGELGGEVCQLLWELSEELVLWADGAAAAAEAACWSGGASTLAHGPPYPLASLHRGRRGRRGRKQGEGRYLLVLVVLQKWAGRGLLIQGGQQVWRLGGQRVPLGEVIGKEDKEGGRC